MKEYSCDCCVHTRKIYIMRGKLINFKYIYIYIYIYIFFFIKERNKRYLIFQINWFELFVNSSINGIPFYVSCATEWGKVFI